MPIDNAIRAYQNRKLAALYDYHGAYEMRVNLAPNQRYVRGRVLGQFTSAANDVQTISVTGTPTGGTFALRIYHPLSGGSSVITVPYNASAATLQALYRGQLGANVTVTGGPGPGTPWVVTGSGAFVNMPLILAYIESTAFTGGATPAAAIVKTTHGRTLGTFDYYTPAAADGREVARAINAYEVTSNSGGFVTHGPVAVEGYQGEVFPSVPAYFSGIFDTKELVGLDADAVNDLGRLWRGTLANGELRVF